MSGIIQVHEDIYPNAYQGWMEQRLRAKGVSVPVGTGGTIFASINHGRWIAECPNECGDAVVTSTASRFYACGVMGCTITIWYGVKFPSNRKGIEDELKRRPFNAAGWPAYHNWSPGETTASLAAEALEQGVVGTMTGNRVGPDRLLVGGR